MRWLATLGIAFFFHIPLAFAQCAPPVAGAWGSVGSGTGYFATPFGVAVGPDGTVYVTDEGNNRVQKFDANGRFLGEWPTGVDTTPTGIAIDETGVVYVALHHIHKVARYTTSGILLDTFGTPAVGPGQLAYPVGIALGTGKVYVANSYDGSIGIFDPSGIPLGRWGNGGAPVVTTPWGLAIDSAQNVYVSDFDGGYVARLSSNGTVLARLGTYGSGDGMFRYPSGIRFDAAGDLYVVDGGNDRIQKLTSSGVFLCQWGATGTALGQFSHPSDIALDGLGQIYVTDWLNNRVQSFGDKPVPTHATTWGRLKATYRR